PDAQHFIKRDHNKMVESHPDFVVFNGEVNKYDLAHAIPIKVGKLVRVFFVNAGPNLTSGFHVAGAIFSTVYQGGNPANALHGVDSFMVAPATGAVFEFQVGEPGNYRFTDLQMAHQYRGALGNFK